MCEARAVASYAYGHKDPETPKMAEGTRLHLVVQAYLRDGTIPAPHELAARKLISVMPYQPGCIEPHNVERVLQLPGWFGKIDFETNDHNTVGDLKFTSALKYQLAVDPKRDTQRIVYACDAFYRDPSRKTVTQHWCVGQFDGQEARVLECVWSRAEAWDAYVEHVDLFAERLAQNLANTDLHWQDVPKNMASCGKYPPNGCNVAHLCERSLRKRLLSMPPK